MDKEFVRQQLITFNTTQEVCDALGINVETLLLCFDEEFNLYVANETELEEGECDD